MTSELFWSTGVGRGPAGAVQTRVTMTRVCVSILGHRKAPRSHSSLTTGGKLGPGGEGNCPDAPARQAGRGLALLLDPPLWEDRCPGHWREVPAAGGMAALRDMSPPDPGACEGGRIWKRVFAGVTKLQSPVRSPWILWLGPDSNDSVLLARTGREGHAATEEGLP